MRMTINRLQIIMRDLCTCSERRYVVLFEALEEAIERYEPVS